MESWDCAATVTNFQSQLDQSNHSNWRVLKYQRFQNCCVKYQLSSPID